MNNKMSDGSRQFGELPQTVLWDKLREHISKLPGAIVTGFLTDGITEAWIDFSYRGQRLSINDQFGEYLFFAVDPSAPDDVLEEVLAHCKLLLR